METLQAGGAETKPGGSGGRVVTLPQGWGQLRGLLACGRGRGGLRQSRVSARRRLGLERGGAGGL